MLNPDPGPKAPAWARPRSRRRPPPHCAPRTSSRIPSRDPAPMAASPQGCAAIDLERCWSASVPVLRAWRRLCCGNAGSAGRARPGRRTCRVCGAWARPPQSAGRRSAVAV